MLRTPQAVVGRLAQRISQGFNDVFAEFLDFASTGASQLHPVLEILCYGAQIPESSNNPESPQGFVF